MSTPTVNANFTLFNVSFDKRSLPNIVEKAKPVVVALAAMAIFATALGLYAATFPMFSWVPIGYWLTQHLGSLALLSGASALGAHFGVNALYNRVITPWAKEQAESVYNYNRNFHSALSTVAGSVIGHCFVIGVVTLLDKQGAALWNTVSSLWANRPSLCYKN
jgi:hypothetical protein